MTKAAISTAAILIIAAVVGGCDTTSVAPYRPSVSNILALRTALADEPSFSIEPFTRSPNVTSRPGCRSLGPIDVAPGSTVEQYIHDAIQTEIFEAGRLSSDASAGIISGRVEEFALDTWGTGLWTLAVRLSSRQNASGVLVRIEYSFATSWMADSACANAAMAFGPAVNALIAEAVRVGAFEQLLGSGSAN